MPLYEVEDGTSRKFYRVEREGRCVRLNWGRIGTEGTWQTIELADEAEAKAEYRRQMQKRLDRGYTLVVDEDVPRDKAAAGDERLTRTSPLSDSPRFLFIKKKAKAFVWVEARGDALVRAEGTIGRETEATPRSEACGSAAAAVKKRDLAAAKLLAAGYELASFGTAEAAPKSAPSGKARPLLRNRELEAHVREDPYAEDRWAVLEDWALEQDDPRAEIVRLEKSGDRGDVALALGRCYPLLFGSRAPSISARLSIIEWRAGFLCECIFDIQQGRDGGSLFQAFVRSPAASLVRSLTIIVRLDDFRPHLVVLAKAPMAESLRSLVIEFRDWKAPTQDTDLGGEVFAPLSKLESLALRGTPGARLLRPESLPPIRRLEHTPTLSRDFGALLVRDSLPELRALTLNMWAVERGTIDPERGDGAAIPIEDIGALLSGEAAPHLEELNLPSSSASTAKAVLDALSTSELRRRLRTLVFGWKSVEPAALRELYGSAFDHLSTLQLPE